MLVQLLYASRSVEPIDDAMVESILTQSRRYNPDHGITGVLCVCRTGNVFLQALEGGRGEVNRLYNRICRDPRHENVELLRYEEIRERRFANWRMGGIDLDKVNRSTILRYAENTNLDPFALTGKSALSLLTELAETAAVVSRDGD